MSTALEQAECIAAAAWEREIEPAPVYGRQRAIWPEPTAPVLPPRPMPRGGSPSGSAASWLLVALVVLPLVTWLVAS